VSAAVRLEVTNADVMRATLRKAGLAQSGDASALYNRVHEHFKQRGAKSGALFECTACAGLSTEDCERCPYCGGDMNEETSSTASAAPTISVWPTIAERLTTLAERGPVVRYRTGIDELDALCRGGVVAGKLCIVAGPPEAGKTTMLAQIARTLAEQACAVAYVAADDAEGVDGRHLMSLGLPRERAESPDAEAIELAQERLAGLVLETPPPDVALEDVFARMAATHRGRQLVVIVDSLQSLAEAEGYDADGARARIDNLLLELKERKVAYNAIVFVASEVHRGVYRSKKSAADADPRAAGKDSGGIEYKADLQVLVRNVPGDGERVELTVSKNRLGKKGVFELRLDKERATFLSVGDEEIEPATKSLDVLEGQVLAAVTANPGSSGSEVVVLVRSKKALVFEALASLRAAGRIVNVGTKSRPAWKATDAARDTPDTAEGAEQ
jgi:archaellum biogenesis ATPase FlaH